MLIRKDFGDESADSRALLDLDCERRLTVFRNLCGGYSWRVVAPGRAFVIDDCGHLRVAELGTECGHLRRVFRPADHLAGETVQLDLDVRVGVVAVDDRIVCEGRKNTGRSGSALAVARGAIR